MIQCILQYSTSNQVGNGDLWVRFEELVCIAPWLQLEEKDAIQEKIVNKREGVTYLGAQSLVVCALFTPRVILPKTKIRRPHFRRDGCLQVCNNETKETEHSARHHIIRDSDGKVGSSLALRRDSWRQNRRKLKG